MLNDNKTNSANKLNQYDLFQTERAITEHDCIKFIKENLLQKTNRAIANELQLTLGKVRHIQRKFNLIRNDEESKKIRSQLSKEQTGARNPNWRGGRSKDYMHYKRLQIERHPIHVEARRLARKALKSGIITKKPCEVCSNENSEMHHEEYSKPLEVIFLCKKHHTVADRLLKQGAKFIEIKWQLISDDSKLLDLIRAP